MLCKKYLFDNNICIGYIDYDYNAQLLKETENYKTVKGKVEKTISFTYNSMGSVSCENIKTISPVKNVSFLYSYNAANKIEKIEQRENESLVKSSLFLYNDSNVLQKTEIYNSGVLDSLILFEYDTAGKLWRQSVFGNDSALISYQIHQFFFNGIERINFFNSNDVYLGYNLFVHNNDGNMFSFATYGSANDLLEKTIYEYENKLLIKETTADGFGKTIRYLVYFYS